MPKQYISLELNGETGQMDMEVKVDSMPTALKMMQMALEQLLKEVEGNTPETE